MDNTKLVILGIIAGLVVTGLIVLACLDAGLREVIIPSIVGIFTTIGAWFLKSPGESGL